VAGIVLAGGAGARLAGADKGLLELDGTPLGAIVAGVLRGTCARIVVSANRNLERHAAYADAVVVDPAAGGTAYGMAVPGVEPGGHGAPRRHPGASGEGPLAGIHAALCAITEPFALVAPCDMPCLDAKVFALLGARIAAAPRVDAACIHDGEREQPLVLALRSGVRPHLGAYLDAGGRSVRGWLQRLDVATVDDPRPAIYHNVNTGTDLERLRTATGRRGGGGG
jgi:molybdopterin-guanine dinucleotide biosynthesis protein A